MIQNDVLETDWKLEKRIRSAQWKTGVQTDIRRSQMYLNILSLLQESAITMADLKGFSEEVTGRMSFLMGREEA